jgi:mono/diheme cytochrome c family protein
MTILGKGLVQRTRDAAYRASIGLTLLLSLACTDAPVPRVAAAPTDTPYPSVAEYRQGHFGIGRTPARAEMAAWDTDIGPEGAELPSGRGGAKDGGAIYRAQCASCHGMNGEGVAPFYPALIGRDSRGEDFDFASDPRIERTIGNYWSHATTLYDYIRRAMPYYTPGSLSADETYAVTAYLLAANRVIAEDAVLDAAALRAVEMPARGRFVPDDRSPTTR